LLPSKELIFPIHPQTFYPFRAGRFIRSAVDGTLQNNVTEEQLKHPIKRDITTRLQNDLAL